MGALLLSPVALSACSAGQVAQTATQVRDKVGGTATIGDLTIRDAQLEFPDEGVYEAGSDASLLVAISNTGQEEDTLVGISGEGFAAAELVGPPATPEPTDVDATGTPTATPTPSPTAAPGGTAAAPTAAPAPTTAAPAPTTAAPTTAAPTTAAPTSAASTELEVVIPPNSNVFIGGDGPSVELTGLQDELTAGQALDVTMTFERAGDVQVRVLVGVATEEQPRGEPFDFHHEEEGGGETQLGGSDTE
ncbi:hypothetical protein [Modestobacter sp. URMC 112]